MKTTLFAFLLLSFIFSCATRHGIRQAKAYKQTSVAGTVRADDSGRQTSSGINEERFVFIETDTAKPAPQFLVAWVNQQPFSVQAVPVNQPRQVIGKTAAGEEVVLSAKAGHRFWQLLLTPQNGRKADDVSLQEKIQSNAVVLQGRWKDKEFTYNIATEETLQPAFYQ